MKTLKLKLAQNSYPIFINPSLAFCAQTLKKNLKSEPLFIMSHKRLLNLYKKDLAKAFRPFKCEWITIPEGEKHKTLSTCEKLLTELSQKGATRESTLLAFGGGIVGDITGFVASIYMRGISFFQMPTTLLAQVDSSVGGKTGVDLKTGKNLAGRFHQPKAVFICTPFLKSLPQKEFTNGMAEVIKAGLIQSPKLIKFLKTNAKAIQQTKNLEHLIFESVKIKAKIVEKDEKEAGLRAILNYGHTLGHAIEALTDFKTFKHGEAVAMGLSFAAHLSDCLGHSKSLHKEVVALLNLFDLPSAWPRFEKRNYETALSKDKKSSAQKIRFILGAKVGKVDIVPLKLKEIVKWL